VEIGGIHIIVDRKGIGYKGVEWTHLAQHGVQLQTCENGNETSVSIKSVEFLY